MILHMSATNLQLLQFTQSVFSAAPVGLHGLAPPEADRRDPPRRLGAEGRRGVPPPPRHPPPSRRDLRPLLVHRRSRTPVTEVPLFHRVWRILRPLRHENILNAGCETDPRDFERIRRIFSPSPPDSLHPDSG